MLLFTYVQNITAERNKNTENCILYTELTITLAFSVVAMQAFNFSDSNFKTSYSYLCRTKSIFIYFRLKSNMCYINVHSLVFKDVCVEYYIVFFVTRNGSKNNVMFCVCESV